MPDVALPCGCTAVVTHQRGDRLHTCGHGHRYAINARDQIVYTINNGPTPGTA